MMIKDLNPKAFVCIIPEEFRGLGRDAIVKEFNYSEIRSQRGGKVKTSYKYSIDDRWRLWSYAFEHTIAPSKKDREELECNVEK